MSDYCWKALEERKLLPENFCDFEGKNKEKHQGNLPFWREILPKLQGNKYFFQACN